MLFGFLKLDSMKFFKSAGAIALMLALTSCGGSEPSSTSPVPSAGDSLKSACPEVMDLMSKGGESVAKADKEQNITDPAYLDELGSIVKRLDEIEAGIKSDEEAVLVQNLANGFNKILEEQSNDQAITTETGKIFASAAQEMSSACIKAL